MLTEKNELQILFSTVTLLLLRDDAKIHVASARLYNALGKLAGEEYSFLSNVFIRTDDLILFDISLRYD